MAEGSNLFCFVADLYEAPRETLPAAYLKILALLCPREHKVEHSNALKNLSDEQLEVMIAYLETSLAAQASGSVKVIEGMIEPTTVPATALPVLEPPKRKPNRLMMEVDTAIGPQERKPRKRKAPYQRVADLTISRKPAQKRFLPPKRGVAFLTEDVFEK